MRNSNLNWLLLGDVVSLGLVTLFGFASHGTLDTAGVRMFSTFVPLLAAWFLIAPFLGVYRLDWAVQSRQLWRPFWAMILAAPFAAWLRAVWLGGVVLPVFVVVLGGVNAIAILVWRLIFWAVINRLGKADG